jgi:hypothetical protein
LPQRRLTCPARDREDIALLVEHFVKKYSREFKKDVRGVSHGAMPSLEAYDWPGNVRELENIIERSVALATHPVIRLEDLLLELAMHEVRPSRGVAEPSLLSLKEARERFEQAYVLRALERETEPEPHGPGPRRPSQYLIARLPFGVSVRRTGIVRRGWWEAAGGRAAGGREPPEGTGRRGREHGAPAIGPVGLAVLSIAVVPRRPRLDARGAPRGPDLSGVWEGRECAHRPGRITPTLTQADPGHRQLKTSGATAISATDGRSRAGHRHDGQLSSREVMRGHGHRG